MAVFETRIYSETLMQDVSVSVILPLPTVSNMEYNAKVRLPENGEKYQTVWLIGTATADHSKAIRSTRIENYAKKKNVAVVVPNLLNSLGYDLPGGDPYFEYLTVELPTIIRSIFPLSAKREDNFIGGSSNGGFTAFMAALRKPELYSAAFAVGSGGLDIEKAKEAPNGKFWFDRALPTIFGPNHEFYDPHIHDLKVMTDDLLATDKPRPKFYASYGTEDIYYSYSQDVIKHMQATELDFTYFEGPGEHDWAFWDPQFKEVLNWLPLQNGFVSA
uniref:alpha/beta hydrolase n=1 Tax=Candidatus Enterococcus willemsii TaxID=1857215 RepID=UPI00403EF90B